MSVKHTAAQLEAIATINQNLQIIACAGSGKTDVVSRRIANLIADAIASPSEIVAFTFTEKAAAELKERIFRYVHERLGHTEGLAEMFVGTMHAYCLDLLQTYVPETFKYQVLPEVQTRLLVNRYSKVSGLTTCPTSSPGTPTLRRGRNTSLFIQTVGILREDHPDFNEIPTGVLESLNKYMKLLADKAYFDYTGLIHNAVVALTHGGTSEYSAIQNRGKQYRYIIVDEYQDVNPLQEDLIEALTRWGANLCVVGDDDQTIYQWRGSEVTNILSFSDRYDSVKKVVLDDNFRSSEGIVDVAREIANEIDPSVRLKKDMVSSGHQKFERGDILALDNFADPVAEAKWIADKIESLIGLPFQDTPTSEIRGLTWSDFAVLFRSVARDAGELVDELKSRNIPFVIKGLSRLFDGIEVQAFVGCFRYVAGQITRDDFKQFWEKANLLNDQKGIDRIIIKLDSVRQWDVAGAPKQTNLQQLFLNILELVEIREDTVPGGQQRGELLFYQLGKFSQAISDYESINFLLDPYEKFVGFANWLEKEAPNFYDETDTDKGFARPDAVTISTVHQSKGMQWPCVFIPCLRKNRFPASRQGGLNISHVIPENSIQNFERYRGTMEDEKRLFYVAVTRSQKFLFVTYSPGSGNYKSRSSFFPMVTRSHFALTRDYDAAKDREKLTPVPLHDNPEISISFSELKYIFECPYQFKLRFLYGFNSPIAHAMGFGRGLHDALSEIHKRAIDGDFVQPNEAEQLVKRHLHLPFAGGELRDNLISAAIKNVKRYIEKNKEDLPNTIHSEKKIQVHIGDGIVIDGRIDLIKKVDTGETAIVDFKSKEAAQTEQTTLDQLHVYALGYQELTGQRADLVEILNLDENGKTVRTPVDDNLIQSIEDRVNIVGEQMRTNTLPKQTNWCSACERCDFVSLCRTKPTQTT